MTELESLYNMYFKDVYLYIKSISKNHHIAEDITSETFIKALKSNKTFKRNRDIRVWLCQIAKNEYYSYLRKNKRLVFTDSVKEQIGETNVETMMTSREDALKIHEILHRLKEPYKEVFYLRVFGELNFREIGNIFGKTANWACVTFHRARKKIQKEMEDYK